MKIRIPESFLAVALVTVCAGQIIAAEPLDEYQNILNLRITAAVVSGREWPRFPAGVAAFLFDSEYAVGRGYIIFRDQRSSGIEDRLWLEASVYKVADGTWRLGPIFECPASRVNEAMAHREKMRQLAMEHTKLDYIDDRPLDLLEILRNWASQDWVAPIIPFGWVKESDLPALVALLDSTEPCATVQSPVSSYMGATRSTVGNEAAYLIEGFRKDRYPPRGNSIRPYCDIEEIKNWWKKRPGT